MELFPCRKKNVATKGAKRKNPASVSKPEGDGLFGAGVSVVPTGKFCVEGQKGVVGSGPRRKKVENERKGSLVL
jgi:hypothetical protein